jgi:transcriptional regulator with XRE-family HTH domain
MGNRLGNYLRARRRQWELTQKELAFLLGYDSAAIISRFERSGRRIPLALAFACYLIFDEDPKELFAHLFERVEEGGARRLSELYERLKRSKPSQRTAAKMRLLRDALARVAKRAQPQEL